MITELPNFFTEMLADGLDALAAAAGIACCSTTDEPEENECPPENQK